MHKTQNQKDNKDQNDDTACSSWDRDKRPEKVNQKKKY